MEREQKTMPTTKRVARNKKPYVKPTCNSETIYETVALACGKLPGAAGSCSAAPKGS